MLSYQHGDFASDCRATRVLAGDQTNRRPFVHTVVGWSALEDTVYREQLLWVTRTRSCGGRNMFVLL
jgi:hypothetical protein